MLWKRIVRDYFTFNKRERRGIYSLVVLLIALTSTHLFLKFDKSHINAYTEQEIATFNVLAESIQRGGYSKQSSSQPKIEDRAEPVDWHTFDPNLATVDELVDLGLKPWIAERIINFREKVKPFSDLEDLASVYDIDTNWLKQAEPFIAIDPKLAEDHQEKKIKTEFKKPKQRTDSTRMVLVDLNTADTTQLKSIRGIGSFYAKQIVELRERYKGFRSFDQLLDLYKVSEQTLTILSEHTLIDTTTIQRIDLNSCTLEDLGRHPYLTWKQARIILAYRDQHERFRSVKEIMRTDVISDSVYLKIAPYLEVK